MLALLAANVVLTAKPIVFEASFDGARYAFGDKVRLELRAKNVSNEPIVLAKAIWDGAPAASATAVLTRNGQTLETVGESSMPLVQVEVSNRVTSDRFVTIPPGKTETLFFREFEREYDFHGSTTRTKADFSRASLKPLEVGKYTCVVTYSFDPAALARPLRRDRERQFEFGPGAKALWDSALKAKVSLTRNFEVR